MTWPRALSGFSLGLGLWTTAAVAGDIYRCDGPAGVAYQDAPCATPRNGGRIDTASIAAADVGERNNAHAMADGRFLSSTAVPTCSTRAVSRARTLWRRTSLCIGMTDDEVLNLKGWGRPTKIARTRGQREWREDWTYETPVATPRALHFVNGALALVEIGRANEPGASEPAQLVTVSSAAPPLLPSVAPARSAGSFDVARTP